MPPARVSFHWIRTARGRRASREVRPAGRANLRKHEQEFSDGSQSCVRPAAGFNHAMTSSQPLIIAVDDEPDDIFFLRRLLGKIGRPHEFQPFANAEAAMTALAAWGATEAPAALPLLC